MQIEQKTIDEILNRTDIVETIRKSLKVKKSGANYFACCPFHNEKTPSFSINSKEQFFHCFGCGESGNVITFVMRYYGYDFIEAVKHLGHDCGVHIEESAKKYSFEEIKKQKEEKLTLTTTINKATKFYQDNLSNNANASNYLFKRGLTKEVIQKFILGFAPDNYTALSQVFSDYTSNQYLQSSGLTLKNSQNKLYDRFRNRIIFPLRNIKGEIIAYGGRIIDSGEPKYLNSPETELFNKSLELYGLYEAQKAIRDKKYALVVEGYMDVIALQQFGVDNVVATMGTSATEEHIKKLFRLCDDIYFCFDGDKAGQKAAWRALERSMPLVTDTKAVRFAFLPQEHDPDSYIRKFGYNQFIDTIKNSSLMLSEYLLNELSQSVNLKTEEGKAKLISHTKPYLEKIKATALQVMLKKQLANIVNLEPIVLESILNNRSRYAFYNSKVNKRELPKTPLPAIKFSQIQTIMINVIHHIDWIHNYRLPDNINDYAPELQELILFLDYIGHNYNTNDKIDISEVIDKIEFNFLNINHIIHIKRKLKITEIEFIDILQSLLGFKKNNAIKIPKIPMRKKER
ncbi:MAG: DNA primase [Neisseriaceae bacterium]